jgi:hypothetical protein
MLFLLAAYLYKFHLKTKVDKLASFLRIPFFPIALQPVEIPAENNIVQQ